MEEFTKPSITKLARKAGIKTMSDECYQTIRNLIALKIDLIVNDVILINSERKTKTVMIDDLIDSYSIRNKFISKSVDLNK